MRQNSVIFKGTPTGLILVLDPDAGIEDILKTMQNKIASAGRFFKGAILDVTYRGRQLTKDQEIMIFDLLSSKSGAKITKIEKEAKIESEIKQNTTDYTGQIKEKRYVSQNNNVHYHSNQKELNEQSNQGYLNEQSNQGHLKDQSNHGYLKDQSNLKDNAKTDNILSKSIQEDSTRTDALSKDKLMQDNTKFFKGTLRSGQKISYNGHVVVLGDINPGAEIIASGNVLVMGVLRGMVHAGCDGDRSAIIAAIRISPMQLRIADTITRPPEDGETDLFMTYEVARIIGNNIVIDGVKV